jgi:hypothetical protein
MAGHCFVLDLCEPLFEREKPLERTEAFRRAAFFRPSLLDIRLFEVLEMEFLLRTVEVDLQNLTVPLEFGSLRDYQGVHGSLREESFRVLRCRGLRY